MSGKRASAEKAHYPARPARVDPYLDDVLDVAMGLSIHSEGSVDDLVDEAMAIIVDEMEDEDEDEDGRRRWGGSCPGRARNKEKG
mmetsp:Transcript_28014/g.62357  ORF Transcript_28014/g.62357 Transcript_28014/m.62357 type:complete len:85 (-) Transcript_28014:205-459(-)